MLTAALCLGLPVLGFFTPTSSLAFSFTHGDVVTAGVDLLTAAVGFGLLAAALAGALAWTLSLAWAAGVVG